MLFHVCRHNKDIVLLNFTIQYYFYKENSIRCLVIKIIEIDVFLCGICSLLSDELIFQLNCLCNNNFFYSIDMLILV